MQLDPRTHVVVLIVATILLILADDSWQLHALVGLSALYLICHGMLRKAFYFVLAYIAILALTEALAGHSAGFGLILYTFSRMMPVAMIGAVLVQTSPSRIMYAFERAKLPRPITVMLCILIRFFPVLLMEIFAIRDGIRARGIFPRWHSALRRPVVIYECYFVPLMVRCLKLSSELASSAELRGIESRNNRSTIHLAELRGMDAAAVALYAMLGAMTVAAGGTVL